MGDLFNNAGENAMSIMYVDITEKNSKKRIKVKLREIGCKFGIESQFVIRGIVKEDESKHGFKEIGKIRFYFTNKQPLLELVSDDFRSIKWNFTNNTDEDDSRIQLVFRLDDQAINLIPLVGMEN